MSDHSRFSIRTPKLAEWARPRLLFFLVALVLPLVASNSNAQEADSRLAPQAATATAQPSPENQQSSTGKAGRELKRTGSITGRALGDDGRPVANATVMVFGLGGVGPPVGDTTDADGKFLIKDLRPGSYMVQAFAHGYVMVPEVGAEPGAPRVYHIGESVNLTMVRGGVITGTVTDSEGEPVIAAGVRAIRVRKPSERRANAFMFGLPRMTDDRGVYRLYGLEPGVYVIAVGGAQPIDVLNAYDAHAPTYYPSATRDTASELTLHAGEELTGIDVRYRAERGHNVSGFLSGITEKGSGFSGVTINLLGTATGAHEAATFIVGDENKRAFALGGIADGDYTLTAILGLGNTNEALMALRRISVRGVDVTGLELKLEPLGSLAGKLILEPPPQPDCTKERDSTLEEIVITARRDEKERADESAFSFLRRIPATPNDKGDFKLNNLRGGNHRLDVQLPDDGWYVRSIITPDTAPAGGGAKAITQGKAAGPGAFTLKAGERLTGLTVTVGQGAANLRGRVKAAAEGASLPARLRAHLVPVEPERATDVLRYQEVAVEGDGRFALNNIAPGRYWLLARAADTVSENEAAERSAVALEMGGRNLLRRSAETTGVEITLQPCQRLADYVLNYGATPPKQPAGK